MSANKIEVAVGTVGTYEVKVTPPKGFSPWADTTTKQIEFFTSSGTLVGAAKPLTIVDANLGIFSFELDATISGTAQTLNSKMTFVWAGGDTLITGKTSLKLDVVEAAG